MASSDRDDDGGAGTAAGPSEWSETGRNSDGGAAVHLLLAAAAYYSSVAASFDEYNTGRSPRSDPYHATERFDGSFWVPIGWERISGLVKNVQVNGVWDSQLFEWMDIEEGLTVADLAAPYWERPAGPIWWCHLSAGHSTVEAFLNNAQWLHPAVSLALRDESKLISERMKHLLYEVPVRVAVAGGLLLELLGQSAGDPYVEEYDIPVVVRSWQAQNFLITVLHIKGSVSGVNVLGITEVQIELLAAGGYNVPRTVHDAIAYLASRLTRWDDRHIECMPVMVFFSILSEVIRVKWSLHAREEIVFELMQHLRGNAARSLLEGIRKSTREMIEEQKAVRDRLFTIQDVMQSTVRAWLQDRSLRVTHNLAVIVLSIITGLFGINVDGIPGSENSPYAFGLFTAILITFGIVLIVIGIIYLGLKEPVNEEKVQVRKLELNQLVKMFEHEAEAEAHAQVRKSTYRNNLTPTSGDDYLNEADYVLIQ
ncbi:serine-rich adhesin for platelets-like [Hibiscus syriacus]|uniref:Serine-rich adhesin for platelets-like n=1 Tax=Hibiscus syriacus TaxID=106335 RepID=A0A6A2WNS8_HIBSY|nr:serine-rich adhesin for platelets-like [Hibiscus syriacus]